MCCLNFFDAAVNLTDTEIEALVKRISVIQGLLLPLILLSYDFLKV